MSVLFRITLTDNSINQKLKKISHHLNEILNGHVMSRVGKITNVTIIKCYEYKFLVASVICHTKLA